MTLACVYPGPHCWITYPLSLPFVQPMVMKHQERRALVTDEVVEQFMKVRPLEF